METEKVFFTISDVKIMTAKHILEEAGIPCFVMDKRDSAYAGIFGEIELYVSKDDHTKAEKILKDNEIIDNE